MAKLYYRYSTMGAGKTIDLLKVSYNYEEKGKRVLLFTSSMDDRYGIGKITSRIGIQRDALVFDKGIDIFDIVSKDISKNGELSCVLVDEAQFLSKKNVIELVDVVDKLDIPVICYGLKNNFQANLFEGSQNLLIWADNIEEIKTICHCGRKATMVLRTQNGKPVYEGEEVVIGGNSSYVPVCRKHYREGKIN